MIINNKSTFLAILLHSGVSLLLIIFPFFSNGQTCAPTRSYQKIIGENVNEWYSYAQTITNTLDGNIMAIATVPTTGSAYYGDFVLRKLDLNGNLLWNKRYTPSSSIFFGAGSLYEDSEGNIIVCGVERIGSKGSIALVKTDALGNVLWSKRYDQSAATWGNA